MMLTLGQAAKAVNVSKSTISRAIKEGRMSSSRTDNGEYQIDPAELFRVYPIKAQENAGIESLDSSSAIGVDELRNQIKQLRDRLRDKDQHIETLQRQVDDVQKDREHWRQQATYLLEDKREKETTITANLSSEQELREKLAQEKALQEQIVVRLTDMQNSFEKVRGSWIGRLFFKI
jgi:excisionase family DNA binding protein